MQMFKYKKIFVMCFPHIGTLDNWLPIVNSVKNIQNEADITLLIPDTSILKAFHRDNAIVSISDNIFDKVFIYAYDETWVKYQSVFDSIKHYKNNHKKLILHDALMCLSSNKIFSYLLVLPIFFLRKNIYKKVSKFKFKDFYLSNKDVLFYDVHVHGNCKTMSILQLFENNIKYSLPHALNTLTFDKLDPPRFYKINKKDNVRIYAHAEFQRKYYDIKYGINLNKVHVVGIPRHDYSWINFVQNNSHILKKGFDKNTILILSRNVLKQHLLFIEKLKSVKNIKRIFIDNLGMKVVIKAHPNENHKTIIGRRLENIYEDIFGLENYGKTWIYSNLHVFSLGQNAKLAISFNTGVVLDLIAMGVPCVEYIESTNNYERSATEYSKYGFIDRVSNIDELSVFVDKWIEDNNKLSERSMNAYKNFFPVLDNISNSIAAEVLKESKINNY